MKRVKQSRETREQLNQEYFQLAATAGDLDLNIETLRRRRKNVLSSMSVLIRRIEGMPAPSAPVDGGEAPPEAAEATPSQDTSDAE